MSEASLTRYATAWEALQMGWEDIQSPGLDKDGFVVRVMETADGWGYYF